MVEFTNIGREIMQKHGEASWTSKDRELAQKDGWDLFDYDGTGLLEIQRLDETEHFDNDAEAVDFVMILAACDFEHARKALEIHRRDLKGILTRRLMNTDDARFKERMSPLIGYRECPKCEEPAIDEWIEESTWQQWRCPACGSWNDKP